MEGKEGKIFCQSMTDDERRNVFGEGYFAYLAKTSKKKGAMVGYIIAFWLWVCCATFRAGALGLIWTLSWMARMRSPR